ncbi:TPA: hypothetical protein DEP30_03065 [Candidatus Nomurabacteria bacterium]|nr:MAG: hypothetical protein UR97_C0004G0121 [Candidatus Nomurabacteria bacterium GW2011_GWE2_36_115]KKP94252.1 MAG: hypothetical protein US00_C0003G0176 [Candidatus Nomurabacteria bacterium GW2011_GWF2_36_126]KKP96620.1 MAG: hypothetical protein US04_C0001G0122 [Candidatus Nomurabacteria bacterium GW2011_GWD2_36_14]KKP99776.1 MAG: hypothetical protein US08_C0001G0459 [Candidatus Nomurabacteria bacterium GW2011_GWF2_36_19]KKQ05278.1 MAG: hypothetical protein US17_C0005G0045 [Candidatus Nomuraba
MTTTNGKVGITHGTILVMSLLVIVTGGATVLFVTCFHQIFFATPIFSGVWAYIWGLLSLCEIMAFFVFYGFIFDSLQKYFLKK